MEGQEVTKKEEHDKTPKTSFKWTDEKVAEVARMISDDRASSELWTSDLTAELGCIKRYKFNKRMQQLTEKLELKDIEDNKVIVDKTNLEKLIKFLSSYQAELQSIY